MCCVKSGKCNRAGARPADPRRGPGPGLLESSTMLKIKKELQDGLAFALSDLSPDAATRAVFESPKVAAHGDFATTAAMQLAKPLKLNPRQLAEQIRAATAEEVVLGDVDEHEEVTRGAAAEALVAAAAQLELLARGHPFGHLHPQTGAHAVPSASGSAAHSK